MGLAERFGAELFGVSAAQPSLGAVFVGGAAITDEIYREERRSIEQRLDAAEEQFRALVPRAVKHRWRGQVEGPGRTIVNAARQVELVMMSPSDDGPLDTFRHANAVDVVLGCGRPLLLTGADVAMITANKILVAWKDEREARRAVSDALPFLGPPRRSSWSASRRATTAARRSALTTLPTGFACMERT